MSAPPSTPPLQLHDLPPDPHTPTPAETEQAKEQRILAAATQMAVQQAHWGPEISSPGLSIALVETGRTKTPQGTEITYHITGSGFAPIDRLSLVRWPLNSAAETLMSGITFNDKGLAVCAAPPPAAPANLSSAPAPHDVPPAPTAPSCTKKFKPGDPIEIQTTAAPGEVVRVAILGQDRKHGAATSAIPFPLAGQDKACRLQVLLGMKDAEMVLIEGTGFPANTPLKLDTTSYGSSRTLNTKTNADGRLMVLVLPGVKGHDSGDTTVKFGGITHVPSLEDSKSPAPADPDCDPSVTFPWGRGSYKPQ